MRTWRRGVFVFACVLTTSSCLAGARAATELRASLEEEGERNAFVALGTGGTDDVADGTITSAWRRRHRQLGGDNSGPTDPGGDDGGDSGVPVPSPTRRPTPWPTPKPSTSAPSSTFAPTATFAPSWAPTLSSAPSLFYPTGLPMPKPSAAVDDVIDDDSLRPRDLPTFKPTTLAPSLSPLPSLAPTISVAPTLSVRPTPKPSHTFSPTLAPSWHPTASVAPSGAPTPAPSVSAAPSLAPTLSPAPTPRVLYVQGRPGSSQEQSIEAALRENIEMVSRRHPLRAASSQLLNFTLVVRARSVEYDAARHVISRSTSRSRSSPSRSRPSSSCSPSSGTSTSSSR